MMKQLQFYKYATWALLLLNLSMVAFFFLTAPPPPKGEEFDRKGPIDIVKMDEQQNESFLQLAEQHKKQMVDLNDDQRKLLKPYFNSLINPAIIINSDSLLNQVQLLEQRKIESTYQHFQEVKSMLRPEQQSDFKEFMNRALERILLEQNNPPPPKKN